MDKLPEIKAAYDWFFKSYEKDASVLAGENDIAAIDRLNEHRDIIERGFFVLMFGQFEKVVNSTFNRAREDRVNNPDWTRRRGWDTASLSGGKVPFETRLALVLDKRSSSYGKVISTYAMRNHCSHGGTVDPVGSIDALYNDLMTWRAELRA